MPLEQTGFMDWFGEINWFAIHVKRFREVIAASSVAALSLEVFLPMVKVEPTDESIIKVNSKPLFPGYFFARFRPLVSLDAVESARGVLHVIKSGAYPIVVEEQVIHEVQGRVAADGLIRLQHHQFKPG